MLTNLDVSMVANMNSIRCSFLFAALIGVSELVCTAALPEATAWPPAFHAELAKFRDGQEGRTDLYYDWVGGRNLHVDHMQGQPPFYDNERQNGSTYYYHLGGSCKVIDMGVGLLPPNWLDGAHYNGTVSLKDPTGQTARTCHVFQKGDAMGNFTGPFITYYEDVETHLPIKWTFFDGMSFDILAWHVNVSASEEDWQIPPACFKSSTSLQASPKLNSFQSWRLQLRRLFGGASSIAPATCTGHRCDHIACPCGCECGTDKDPGLCFSPVQETFKSRLVV